MYGGFCYGQTNYGSAIPTRLITNVDAAEAFLQLLADSSSQQRSRAHGEASISAFILSSNKTVSQAIALAEIMVLTEASIAASNRTFYYRYLTSLWSEA